MIDEPLETRPIDVAASNWKNRYLVSAKLSTENHKKFLKYCKDNNLNYSSGINNLIATYLTNHNV